MTRQDTINSIEHRVLGSPPETISGSLRWGAQRWPDKPFALLPDGCMWTRSDCLGEAEETARRLVTCGIGRKDRVFLMLPNGKDWLRLWWGLALIDAIMVPINPAFRGNIFNDLFDRIDPKAILIEAGSERRLTAQQQRRVLLPDSLASLQRTESVVWANPAPEDPHAIILTSGTTGFSKGAILSHRQLCRQAAWFAEGANVGEQDTFLADLPLFHLGGLSPITTLLRCGGAFALRVVPSMTNYWEVVRDLGITYSYLAGTMAAFLAAQPTRPGERDHKMRFIHSAPLPADIHAFLERFGLEGVTSCYGSTESSIMIVQPLNKPLRAGSCGKLREGYEARLIDAEGNDVTDGELGELVIRNSTPGAMMLGYFGDPDATARAWDSGWYRSGDMFRRDSDGYYYWQDRAKDCLRRRGENISSFEVEREVITFPGIAEVACVGHASDIGGDDEVKVFIVPEVDTQAPDWLALVHHLVDRMPYFMVPRFYEMIDALPKTPTNRVQKFQLRQKGNCPSTWDREAFGITIGRDGRVRIPTHPTEEAGVRSRE